MIKGLRHGVSALAIALLAACGGGGGGGGSVAPVISSAPPVSGSPNATFAATSQTASDMAANAKSGASAIVTVNGFNALPLAIQTAPMAVTSTDTMNCTNGGSATVTSTMANSNAISANDSVHIVFSNCIESPLTFSGTLDGTFTRWVSDVDFTLNFSASNFSLVDGAIAVGPVSFSGQVSEAAGVVNYSFDVGTTAVVGTPVVTVSGSTATISSGVIRGFLGTGSNYVEVSFSNWSFNPSTGIPTSGTATITGASGYSAVITVQSDGYHVAVTVNGSTSTFVVAF